MLSVEAKSGDGHVDNMNNLKLTTIRNVGR